MRKAMFVIPILFFTLVSATEYHVAKNGAAGNDGSATRPLLTVQAAALLAQPGDIITVHTGTYRERVNPPRGGTSNTQRITYRAFPGDEVILAGSEIVKGWINESGKIWRVSLPNTFFGSFNPYLDSLHGDWFTPKGRRPHTGAVYLNGEWMLEAAAKNALVNKQWCTQVTRDTTTIWAWFEVNPNEQLAEINVRQTVFYPKDIGKNFITIRGFVMRHAATPWSPPTAEQIGLIGTNWSKGWIIENNTVSHSMCAGITLGKYGDAFDNTSGWSAEGYVETINRALTKGWNKATVGSHIVRNNTIFSCEQAGIVGSLGAVFSNVTGNTIHDIHVLDFYGGVEMAGIKIHGAIDMEISHNHIYHTADRGIWLDWMAQGTRVSGNIVHGSLSNDIFVEVNHGPILIDNNLFLSSWSVWSWTSGTAFVHNLIAGQVVQAGQSRKTPHFVPHSTEIVALDSVPSGDARWYNNILVGSNSNLGVYDNTVLPNFMGGNVFLAGAKAGKAEISPIVLPAYNPGLTLTQVKDSAYLEFKADESWRTSQTRSIITSAVLGKVKIANAYFEDPAGNPTSVDTDFFGKPRNKSNPFPGPFEQSFSGRILVYGGSGDPITVTIPGLSPLKNGSASAFASVKIRPIVKNWRIVIQKKEEGKAAMLFNIAGRQLKVQRESIGKSKPIFNP